MHIGFLLDSYRDKWSCLKCQSYKGVVIPAKPVLLLSMLSMIDNEKAKDNRFIVQTLKEEYESMSLGYNLSTPYQYPLYFLESEDFYHLKWKMTKVVTKTPSEKLIRENVEYAYFDNALWDLLQDKETREYFRECIIKNYLN